MISMWFSQREVVCRELYLYINTREYYENKEYQMENFNETKNVVYWIQEMLVLKETQWDMTTPPMYAYEYVSRFYY